MSRSLHLKVFTLQVMRGHCGFAIDLSQGYQFTASTFISYINKVVCVESKNEREKLVRLKLYCDNK